jgi:hypothetical protein
VLWSSKLKGIRRRGARRNQVGNPQSLVHGSVGGHLGGVPERRPPARLGIARGQAGGARAPSRDGSRVLAREACAGWDARSAGARRPFRLGARERSPQANGRLHCVYESAIIKACVLRAPTPEVPMNIVEQAHAPPA